MRVLAHPGPTFLAPCGALLALALFTTGCRPTAEEPATPGELAHPVVGRAALVLEALQHGEVEALAALVHPTKGIRLSPYGFVAVDEDQLLTRDQLVAAWSDPEPRRWGTEDGTGDPIVMSGADYFAEYVYDVDFMHADQTSVDERIGHGNTIDNARDVYPDATIFEAHFPGFDPKYEGLDWRSLRLVFERTEGEWYLVGLIHDQWTI